MGYKVDNAVIMAAGTSSRFAPISYEIPKALIEVKGEILIERQIKQLLEAGIKEIIVVVGYKKECFEYLIDKYGVCLVENKEYLTRNNNASIYAVRKYLKNSFICSSDNYFLVNPFTANVDESYYAAMFSNNETSEWCMDEDEKGFISKVSIGGKNKWYMLGHTFWSENFSKKFLEILTKCYENPATYDKYWEDIFIENIECLKMQIKKYQEDFIFEFDSLDELRSFDSSYIDDTRSSIIKSMALKLNCKEREMVNFKAVKDKDASAIGFTFIAKGIKYKYLYDDGSMAKLD